MAEQQQNAKAPQSTNELAVRREKLQALVDAGNNPYEITKFDISHSSVEIKAEFERRESELTESGEQLAVRIGGRMVSRRIMGKASFAHIDDGEGKIQLYVARDALGEDVYASFKKWDVGDILGIEGFVFRTKTGEVSIHATSATLLSKSLLPDRKSVV